MSYISLLLVATATMALAGAIAVLYKELKNQSHIWHSPCVTPAATRDDIVRVLRIFQEVLHGKGITWWLDYGTLLGAWRVNGPMAFDHDLDISFIGAHQARLRDCAGELAVGCICGLSSRTSRNAGFPARFGAKPRASGLSVRHRSYRVTQMQPLALSEQMAARPSCPWGGAAQQAGSCETSAPWT